jgi:hypothetical protein
MKTLFCDDKGNLSIQRVQSTLLIVAGIVYAFLYKDPTNASIIIALGVGEKLIQKGIER